MADMVNKGRSLRGEKNPQAKLTPEQVREIRQRYKALIEELATTFSIHKDTIRLIVDRKTWKSTL